MLETPDVLAMPALAVESGPAAGVVAAALVARQKGRANLLSFDMGGTTAKASLIRDGRFETTSEYEIGAGGNVTRFMNGTGHPIRVPVIDLAEVSAGGGSIAWVDRAGALRVGPQSAGALPGPVCYKRGGSEPTVTDCSLLLGYLDQTSLLAGGLPISQAAAAAAVEERLARPLGIDARAAAAAVIAIVNHAMAEALKIVSVKRGWDPREFALLAFGGAGPLHAAALAQELGMAEVICPPIPGAFSALGLVAGDIKRDYVRSVGASTTAAEPARLTEAFAALEAEGTALLARARVAPDRRRLERAVDARYPRQSYELTIAVPDGPLDRAALEEVAQAFHERHQRTYGHAHRDEPVELVSLRLAAIGSVPRLRLRAPFGEPRRAPKSRRAAYFADGGLCSAAVWDRAHLVPAMSIAGPAIIESLDSTVLVPPRWHADTDADGFLLLRRSPAAGGHA
jgi:N-methylhydantoinase A